MDLIECHRTITRRYNEDIASEAITKALERRATNPVGYALRTARTLNLMAHRRRQDQARAGSLMAPLVESNQGPTQHRRLVARDALARVPVNILLNASLA